MRHVYVVEDDSNIRELICYALNNNGYRATGFPSAVPLYEKLRDEVPDLFLLDILLEGDDGYTILETIKADPKTADIPAIMLTAKTEEIDKVKGLDMGADDYMTKPFGVMELLSRVNAVLRRFPQKEQEAETVLSYRDIVLDLAKRKAFSGDEELSLTYKEYELLSYMIVNADIVLSRDRLMSEIWGFDYQGESRTVDVHIRTLRQKLGDNAKWIKTIRNVGYKIGD
jgi:two-component system alkaline phosphatase synthesis response regulator PhoP